MNPPTGSLGRGNTARALRDLVWVCSRNCATVLLLGVAASAGCRGRPRHAEGERSPQQSVDLRQGIELGTPEATVRSFCLGSGLETARRTFYPGAVLEPTIAERIWFDCTIIESTPAIPIGQYLGHIGKYGNDTGFTIQAGDVEVVTQVRLDLPRENNPEARFWYILRKFGDEWRILAMGGYSPDPD